jgi:chaperonin GroES
MKVNPIRDRILVKPIEADTVTASGIVIPDNAQEKPMQGEVLGVGDGKVTNDGTIIPMTVKIGDKILYGKFSGQTVKIQNKDHIILKEDDVLAIVD